jgi:peptidylprolyl isomerase
MTSSTLSKLRRSQGAFFAALITLSMTAAAYAGCSKSDSQTPATNSNAQSIDQNQPMSSASTTPESSQPQASQPAAQAATPAPTTAPAEMPEGNPGKHGDTIITASGLEYIDTKVGTGGPVTKGQTVTVNYTGRLLNGTIFDSNVDPKFGHVQPFTVKIPGGVIQAWNEGILGMKVTGKRRLICPPNLAYGSRGMGSAIPPNSTLIFDVELLKVQ